MNIEDGKVYIRYKRKSEEFIFEKEPILLQFAPFPKNSTKIMRAYFKGVAPNWLAHFDTDYELVQTITRYGKGFCIAFKRKVTSGFLMSPIIKGQLKELLENMGSGQELLKQKYEAQLFADLETVVNNLRYFPGIFQDKGIYYRQDEHSGTTSVMYADPKFWNISYQHECATVEDWQELVTELTKQREYPIELEEVEELSEPIVELEEPKNEETVEVLQEELENEESLDELQEETENEVSLEDLHEEPQKEEILEELQPEPVNELEELEEIQEVSEELEELVEYEANSEELIVPVENTEVTEPDVETQLTDESNSEPLPTLEVAKTSSKKEGIIAGQTFLF